MQKVLTNTVKTCSEFSVQEKEGGRYASTNIFIEFFRFKVDLMNDEYEEIKEKEKEIEKLEYFSIVKSENIDQFMEVLTDNMIPDIPGGFIFAPVSIPVVWVTGMITLIGTAAADLIKSPYTLISNLGAKSRSQTRKSEILLHFLSKKNNQMRVTNDEYIYMRYLFFNYQI